VIAKVIYKLNQYQRALVNMIIHNSLYQRAYHFRNLPRDHVNTITCSSNTN